MLLKVKGFYNTNGYTQIVKKAKNRYYFNENRDNLTKTK